jgi:lipopolysaccharide transport system ATP-binding protein
MTAQPVIRIEQLSKRYLIGHERATRGGETYREMLMSNGRRLVRTARDMARGRQIVQGDEIEAFWALKDVSFEVQQGEVLGVIGRNGAGKSTLLKVLSRITEPSTGRVTIRGRVASLLEVGTGFHPELTGRENIFLNGAVLGMTRAEVRRKFDEIVAFAEVERFLDTPVKRYSSGMYVRLAFAVAAHLEPEILIVDEVLAVGDAEFQRKCLGKMHDVAGSGRTVLFVSHNMAAINSLCHRAVQLSGGELVMQGEVAQVIEHYSSTLAEETDLVFPVNRAQAGITGIHIDRDALKHRDLDVRIAFQSPVPITTPIGGIVLRAIGGEPLWGSNGRFHPFADSVNGLTGGVVRCEARGIPLVPGKYILSVWLGDYYTDFDSKIDLTVVNLGRAEPGSLDHLRPPPAVQGYVDWGAQWTVLPV